MQHANVRENILFGCRFDAVRYESVIRACALAPDFNSLAAGDMTEVSIIVNF